MQGVDDGLAEGQVVLRAGRHHRGPQRLRPRVLRLCRGCCGRGSSRLCRSGGFGGLGCLRLGGGCFRLSFGQRGLEFGDDFGVYRSLRRIHGFRKGRLGFGGGCGRFFSSGSGRVGFGLGGVGFGLGGVGFGRGGRGGCLGFSLRSGRVGAVVGFIVAA